MFDDSAHAIAIAPGGCGRYLGAMPMVAAPPPPPSRLRPSAWRGFANPSRRALALDFLRFGCVGLCGYVFDTAVVYALRGPWGPYGAGVAAYFVAATVTWGLNRAWTFRGRGEGAMHRQWGLFLLVNLAGFVPNRGVYALLIATVPLAVEYPFLATFAGAVAGMFVNFALSRRVVFSARS